LKQLVYDVYQINFVRQVGQTDSVQGLPVFSLLVVPLFSIYKVPSSDKWLCSWFRHVPNFHELCRV